MDSKLFSSKAKQLNRSLWLKQMAPIAAIVVVVLLLLYLILRRLF
jgi:hypothetical protein